jgi:hypothetical protein
LRAEREALTARLIALFLRSGAVGQRPSACLRHTRVRRASACIPPWPVLIYRLGDAFSAVKK